MQDGAAPCTAISSKYVLTLSLRQAGAVSKKIFDCFFLVYWAHLNDIYQILGGWFIRCLETSMYHIWYDRIERVQKWTILSQFFLFIGAFIHSDIIIWNGKYGMENMEKMLPVCYLLLYKALTCIKSSINMDNFTPKSHWFMCYTVYIQYSKWYL